MEIFQSGAHDDLGIEIVAASPERVAIRVPFKPELARSIENMSMHSGVVMTAMDSGMGLACMMNLKEPSSLATLDLRYDELRSPRAEQDIEISVQCDSIDEGIVFLTGSASDADGVFAQSVSRFFLTGESSAFFRKTFEKLANRSNSDFSSTGSTA